MRVGKQCQKYMTNYFEVNMKLWSGVKSGGLELPGLKYKVQYL